MDEGSIVAGQKASQKPGENRAPRQAETAERQRGRGHLQAKSRQFAGCSRGVGMSSCGGWPTSNRAPSALIAATMTPGTWVSTDEYDLYRRLEQWGDAHENVCHSDGADARDDEGDGLCAMHVHTMEGLWSRLRSWRRPHCASRRSMCRSLWVSLCVSTPSDDAVKPYWERYLSLAHRAPRNPY